MGKYKKQSWYIYALAAIIFLTVTFSDWLSQHKVVFVIDIAVLLVLAFGILLFSSLKEWKKSDEEILAGFARKNLIQQEQPVTPRRLIFGAISGLAVFLFIISGSGPMPRPVKIIFSIAVVIVTAVNLFMLLRKKHGTPARKVIVAPREIAAFFLGLIPCLFFCVFIGIGTYHGIWWFVLPPGLFFLFAFSRPLVAAVRSVYRRFHADDEVHVRKGKEIDPWDRSDTDPEKYRRK